MSVSLLLTAVLVGPTPAPLVPADPPPRWCASDCEVYCSECEVDCLDGCEEACPDEACERRCQRICSERCRRCPSFCATHLRCDEDPPTRP
jgi:hypothetical protein